MRDEIIEHRVKSERDRFVNAIDPEAICRLASSYCHNEPCTIFKPFKRGSFNVCFFVEFALSGNARNGQYGTSVVDMNGNTGCKGIRWVVRIPITPRLAFVDEKLEVEVATMRYVKENTTIPIPKVYAYSLLKESPIRMAFMIMDYVEGRTLFDIGILNLSPEQKNVVYEQLADMSIQLRQQEFCKIGALAMNPPRSESGSTFEVSNRPLSVEVVTQELEGLRPTRIFNEKAVYTTAQGYVSSLLQLAFNEFKEGRNSVWNEEDGRSVLYGLHDFKRYVEETWLDPSLNNGPFVLMHGDLGPANILLNDNFHLVAVLDWEWSRVVPIQLFIPPTWLTGKLIQGISSFFDREDYLAELAKFRSIVVDREKLHGGRLLLSESWAKIEKGCSFLIATALINPASLHDVYWRFLYFQLHLREKREDVLEKFTGSSPSYQTLLNRKVREQNEYQEEMKLLGIIGDQNQ